MNNIYRKLENYINQAKESLDICMYMLTCQMLSNAIVNAHKRGVLVRIIMDRSMACNEAAQTALFYKNGMKNNYCIFIIIIIIYIRYTSITFNSLLLTIFKLIFFLEF